MTPEQLTAWASAINILLGAGVATVMQIRSWFSPTVLTNEQLNAILDTILTDALKREAQAKAAAGG
jgi:hypothetical protein